MKYGFSNPNDLWYYQHRYNKKSQKNMKGCVFSFIGFLIILALILFLSSCKSIQYVPVETVKTEYKTNTVHDSVYLEVLKHDSVIIQEKNDTIFITKYHTLFKDRWKEKIVIDTFIKVDSVQIPYPVEKKLTKWEKIKMDAGGISLGACLIFIVMILVCLIKRRK